MRSKSKVSLGISLKVRLIFILGMVLWLWWSLTPYSSVVVPHDSTEMSPLIEGGQKIYVYSRPNVSDYRSGDLVWYTVHSDSNVQRDSKWRWGWVLGRGSETFEIKKGKLYRNGESLNQKISGLPETLNRTFAEVPMGHFFVVHGDQRSEVNDSLVMGSIPAEQIKIMGKAFFLWE
jgi:signal peptidase I